MSKHGSANHMLHAISTIVEEQHFAVGMRWDQGSLAIQGIIYSFFLKEREFKLKSVQNQSKETHFYILHVRRKEISKLPIYCA